MDQYRMRINRYNPKLQASENGERFSGYCTVKLTSHDQAALLRAKASAIENPETLFVASLAANGRHDYVPCLVDAEGHITLHATGYPNDVVTLNVKVDDFKLTNRTTPPPTEDSESLDDFDEAE